MKFVAVLILFLFTFVRGKLLCEDNEVYTACASGCGNVPPEKSCEEKVAVLTCATVCKESCICTDGYARNKEGVCVLIEQC